MSDSVVEALKYVQIVVSILVIVSILLQNRAEGLGKMFGGGGEVFRTKRGFEKVLYNATIVLIVLFAVISLTIVKYN